MLLQIIGDLFGGLLNDAAGRALSRDRRRIVDGRIHCMIRAASGRVLNVPTEWSSGTCTVSAGHLTFKPISGIVGNREIDVLDLRESDSPEFPPYSGDFGEAANFVITTSKGELLWMVPRGLGAEVRARVLAHPA